MHIETTNHDISTFEYQDKLPKLPIPSLDDTCSRYLETVEALLSNSEIQSTAKIVDEFQSTIGPKLQEQLKKYAEDKNSYIEDFWYESYLLSRGSVVLNLNPFFVLEDDPTPSRNNQISRASSLILSTLKFIKALRANILEPDVLRNVPLCMNQFNYLFGCSRFPTDVKDEVVVDHNSKHIVVLCRNQFYWFDVIWDNGDIAINEKELNVNLRAIVDDAFRTSDADAAKNAVGVLTTEGRQKWSELRRKLNAENEGSLDVVDKALFLVCLDNTSPPTAEDFASTALHGTYEISEGIQTGTCTNRWYDKLQIIVCENGVAGVNFEHSVVDGHTVLRFVSDIYTDTIIRFAQTIRGGTQCLLKSSYRTPKHSTDPKRPDCTPNKLEWKLDGELSKGIRYAETKLSDLILQNEVKVLEFTAYGKLFIVKNNMSPDAFVQMAFAASYYSLYGNVVNIYEPVQTKKFLHGRTEAARSMTTDAANFVRVFCSEADPLEKLNALRKAVKTQVNMVKRCSEGFGVDRHLFSLLCIWKRNEEKKGEPLPEIFRDVAWEKICETILSTSNCGNPALRLFGFGPVVQDGFGIGYIIKDEGIQFCVSSKHRQTCRFLDTLQTYLIEVQALLVNEEATRFPNLMGNRVRSLSQRGAFITTTGYGFFDSGGSEVDVEIVSPRVGRKIT